MKYFWIDSRIILWSNCHKKWGKQGFLIGPYLPIYGFGLFFLPIIYFIFQSQLINHIIIILLMGFVMTLIELIGGLISLKIKQDCGII